MLFNVLQTLYIVYDLGIYEKRQKKLVPFRSKQLTFYTWEMYETRQNQQEYNNILNFV